jgi:mannobiose 2-epimerase
VPAIAGEGRAVRVPGHHCPCAQADRLAKWTVFANVWVFKSVPSPRSIVGYFLCAACVAAPLAADEAPAPAVTSAAVTDLARSAERELRGDILPFWLKYTRNPANGGYYGLITADMTVKAGVPRGALLTSRILWTFSTAYRVYGDLAYLEMARWAYRDLMDHFWDQEYGGLYWTIAADGTPMDVHKQIYGQVFGVYALAEFYRATGEPRALDEAIAIYTLIEAHARDRAYGGYIDALDRSWARLGTQRNLLGGAPKSQNSHIHILEAYTELLRVWPDPGLRDNQRALVETTLQHIIDPDTHHLILFMKDDWTPIGDEVSFGHDIELSWLLVEAAQVLGDPALVARVKPISLDIAKVTLAQGVDPDGGVLNEGGPHGLTNTGKDWWPQAEAAVGFLNAYQLSGDAQYFRASRHSWDFIQAKFVDRVHGDWIESVARDGTPLPRPKVSLWKCPYHSGRSCFELIERLHELDQAAP